MDTDNILGEMQFGIVIPLDEKISFNLNTKYLFSYYETLLNTGTTSSKINHNSSSSLSAGLIFKW